MRGLKEAGWKAVEKCWTKASGGPCSVLLVIGGCLLTVCNGTETTRVNTGVLQDFLYLWSVTKKVCS